MLLYFVCPHIYLTLLIYIAGDFVHFTSVSDTCLLLHYFTQCILSPTSEWFYRFEFVCDCTSHFAVIIFFQKKHSSSLILLASFPGPFQLMLQHCKLAWWGPGNEAISTMYTCEPSWAKAWLFNCLFAQWGNSRCLSDHRSALPYMDTNFSMHR